MVKKEENVDVEVVGNVDPAPAYKGLDEMLAKYQDPKQSDALTRVQDELDETKIILHDTMKAVLERGEKLDDLVEKADALSAGTKMFYQSARKMNKCCTWI
uniref:V-SNARE coiled-coil homology domain-containing protein n=1 Tax=Romanomermis culicivorax TaxID=13658 RepID=A0A915IPG1_ROMCU